MEEQVPPSHGRPQGTDRKEVVCEGCASVIGWSKSDAEALAIFKDHLLVCRFGGVKRHKSIGSATLAMALVTGIVVLGIAILGLNPDAAKYVLGLIREADTGPGTPQTGEAPK